MRSKPTFRACWGVVAILFMEFFFGECAAADRVNGQRIAERWCAECHVVASGQQHGSDRVPTFAQIGESKRFDGASLSAFLMDPHHSRMINLSLTRSEISDLVAYIKSQGR
ncbi:Cytochrome c [Rhizobium lusitanum]|uniref:Cytochrome c n=2 Tax=Rhizobium/Agrobacterium group TaxID=227290 RepID=A0A1C3XEN8_9HYPH|nr:Cytochrome c-552 [Ensifer adhaerens]SCB50698.1 Cytochrome c [Rhizobium lusitanum]